MNILRECRERKQYNYQQMADLLNISKTYYWQIENNKRRLSYYMAFKIAMIFNTKPDFIFYDYYRNLYQNEQNKD